MAEYAVFLYAPANDVEEESSPEGLKAHERYSEEMQHEDVMLAAFALTHPSIATSVRGDVMTDGPFLEAKEVVVGFYVIEADDLDEALKIAKRNPILQQGGGIEVRPVQDWVIPQRHGAVHDHVEARPVGRE